jgi:hypothetical protein
MAVTPAGNADGTVYASFMLSRGSQYYPVVDASFDHGATFTQSSSLIPPDPKTWGDRDFIAVGPDVTIYVTWDTQGMNPDGSANDIGWLSFSASHGAQWSAPIQVPPDRLNVPGE